MRKRGRPPVLKPWRVSITGRVQREFIIFARTEEEAREQARLMVKQSFPFSEFSVKRFYGRLKA